MQELLQDFTTGILICCSPDGQRQLQPAAMRLGLARQSLQGITQGDEQQGYT